MGVTVFGHFPLYARVSDKLGARHLDVSPRNWMAWPPTRQCSENLHFLNRTLARGDRFVFSHPPRRANPAREYDLRIEDVTYRLGRPGQPRRPSLRVHARRRRTGRGPGQQASARTVLRRRIRGGNARGIGPDASRPLQPTRMEVRIRRRGERQHFLTRQRPRELPRLKAPGRIRGARGSRRRTATAVGHHRPTVDVGGATSGAGKTGSRANAPETARACSDGLTTPNGRARTGDGSPRGRPPRTCPGIDLGCPHATGTPCRPRATKSVTKPTSAHPRP